MDSSCLENPNPNPSLSNCAAFQFTDQNQLDPSFMDFDELSKYLMLDNRVGDDDDDHHHHLHQDSLSPTVVSSEKPHTAAGSGATSRNGNNNMQVIHICTV